jgi:hypothetical protein
LPLILYLQAVGIILPPDPENKVKALLPNCWYIFKRLPGTLSHVSILKKEYAAHFLLFTGMNLGILFLYSV